MIRRKINIRPADVMQTTALTVPRTRDGQLTGFAY